MLEAYRAGIADSSLKPDSFQEQAAQRLDGLARELEERKGFSLFRRKTTPHGLYIWGDVGRGKSMLMDLFFETVTIQPRRRAHFNAFMVDVHARIHAERQKGTADPIPAVAQSLGREARLLCFDEFQVNDVADAMILGRLFEQLFAGGTVIVATSNVEPDRLYEGGLNRQLFLPFIALIRAHMDVVELNGPTDYRLARIAGVNVYMTPLSEAADRAMDQAWARLTQGARAKRLELPVTGRSLTVPAAALGAARFGFADLCDRPLGAADYLEIARHFHTILLDHIPVMGESSANAARRFVVLIDSLYDEGVKLICSAAAPPEGLYPAGPGADAFRRTASRLAEMQSEDYLKRGHGIYAP